MARLGPNHPEVVQKRGELTELDRTRRNANMSQEIESLTRQLLQLQARLRRAGVPVDLTLQLRNISEEGQLFVSRLTQQAKEYKLEQQNLENQLGQREVQTRYQYSKPPTLNPSPGNKKMISATVTIGVLMVLLSAASTIVFREFFNPIATDDWRIINRYPLPLIGQFPKKDLKNLSLLSPAKIRKAKGRIDSHKLNRNDEASIRLLQNIRSIEQQLVSTAAKGIPGIIYVGQHPDLGALSRAIANCWTIDQDQGVILLDCNHVRPAVHSRPHQDLHSFLNGDSTWRDVKISETE